MSDKFNPLHYLDKRLLQELASEKAQYDLKSHIQKRRTEFDDFYFLITSEDGIIHNDVDSLMSTEGTQVHYKLNEACKKIFWLRINSSSDISHDHLYLPKDSILVHEDISLNKSIKKTNIYSEGEDSYYYLNFHPQGQLFLNEVSFHIKNKFKSYFLTLPGGQRHKNQIDYLLKKNSSLEHFSLSNIQKGQLHDDSINVVHSESSHSKIYYQSLNRGKVSSQVNSLVNSESIGCSTEQKIKHIVLNASAITNSKPNLMISNNDIVASHGNSIGSFSKEDLFYLSQRGLTQEQSYSVLSSSIIYDYLSKSSIAEQLKKYLTGRIARA